MPDTAPRQLVVFLLDGDRYALPIDCVQEIIRYTSPRDVVSEEASVRGVISLRGKILPVHDLATALHRAPTATSDTASIIIVETDDAPAGLVVDAVDEVLTIDADAVQAAPADASAAIDGVVNVDGQLVVLLRAERLLGTTAAVGV